MTNIVRHASYLFPRQYRFRDGAFVISQYRDNPAGAYFHEPFPMQEQSQINTAIRRERNRGFKALYLVRVKFKDAFKGEVHD